MIIIKNKFLLIGVLLIFIGIVITAIPFINNIKIKEETKKQVEEFINDINTENNTEIVQETLKEPNSTSYTEKYIMGLEIPKIRLKKGIYSKDSKYNSVKYGIQLMKESNLPDDLYGNLILASHSGSSNISYFDSLDKLTIGDEVYIYYQDNKYIYSISNVYEQEKNGEIKIIRDKSQTTISLITCKKNTKDKQLIYIGNLIGVT